MVDPVVRGLPMRIAVFDLVREACLELARITFLEMQEAGGRENGSWPAYHKALWHHLVEDRLADDEIHFRGYRSGSSALEVIGYDHVYAATVGFGDDTLRISDLVFHSVRVFLGPAPPPAAAQSTPTPKPTAKRGAGGRPPKYDWETFNAEIVRFADLDGITNRRALLEHMCKWCDETWPEQVPDVETIRRQVNLICRHNK